MNYKTRRLFDSRRLHHLKNKKPCDFGAFYFFPTLDYVIQTLSEQLKSLKKLLTRGKNFDSIVAMKAEPVDIKTIRLELGFTQEDLARKLNVSLSAVSKWEQEVSSPSRLAREKIEKLLRRGGKKKK